MNDSIALAKALLACKGDALKGLQSFEHDHGPKKHKLIDASELSYLWYEQIAQWMDDYTPEQFVYQFMTRTGRIDDERLRNDFPALAERLNLGGARP